MPFVDRRVELQPGVGRGPGGEANAVPQFARRQGLGDLAVGTADQVPRAVGGDAFDPISDAKPYIKQNFPKTYEILFGKGQ